MIAETISLWEGRTNVVLHTHLAHHYPPLAPGPKEKLPAVLICPGGAYLFCSMGDEGDGEAMALPLVAIRRSSWSIRWRQKRRDMIRNTPPSSWIWAKQRGVSTTGQVSYISQGPRSMQVRGSRVPSTSQATASLRTVKRVRKKSSSCSERNTPPCSISVFAPKHRTVPSWK